MIYQSYFYFRMLELQGPDGKRSVPQLIRPVYVQTLIKTILIHFDFRSKFALEQATKAQGWSTLFSTSVLDGGGWSMPCPSQFTPGMTRYPLYRRLGGPQERSGRVRKISSPPPGFDPRTVQSAASRYRLSYPGPIILILVLPKFTPTSSGMESCCPLYFFVNIKDLNHYNSNFIGCFV